MKLVEIDDNNILSYANNNSRVDDEDYSKPRVLSTLDNDMNEILRAAISDVDKWQLYSQTLQRYLNRVKVTSRKIDSNSSYPENNEKNKREMDSFNFSLPSMGIPDLDSFRNTIGTTSRAHQFEMSGVEPIRDSLDSISQPVVRNFFQNARNANVSMSTSSPSNVEEGDRVPQPKKRKAKKTKGIPRRVLPYRSVALAGRKRNAETSISADISQIKPCKVLVQRINWEPSNAH